MPEDMNEKLPKPGFPIPKDQETDEDSCEATCPHCGSTWQDLWDYEWENKEEIEVDCPWCSKPLILVQRVEAFYHTKHVPEKKGDSAEAIKPLKSLDLKGEYHDQIHQVPNVYPQRNDDQQTR